MERKFKVFVDSNVWFSAFYKKESISGKLLKICQEKKITVVISELVLEEVVRNIKRKIPQALGSVKVFLSHYPLVIVKNPLLNQLKKGVKLAKLHDRPILLASLNYHCDFFITGNKKDFNIKKIKTKYKLIVLNPREFFDYLTIDKSP